MEYSDEGLCSAQCSGCYGKRMCNLCPNNYKLITDPDYFCWNGPSGTYINLEIKNMLLVILIFKVVINVHHPNVLVVNMVFIEKLKNVILIENCQRWNYDGCTQCHLQHSFLKMIKYVN
jgi:hypothetical protein